MAKYGKPLRDPLRPKPREPAHRIASGGEAPQPGRHQGEPLVASGGGVTKADPSGLRFLESLSAEGDLCQLSLDIGSCDG